MLFGIDLPLTLMSLMSANTWMFQASFSSGSVVHINDVMTTTKVFSLFSRQKVI